MAKIVLSLLIAIVLLYYSVAWAVLRCPHQENHADDEITVNDSDSRRLSRVDDQTNLDCTGPDYYTEPLAGPSAAPDVLRPVRDIAPGMNVLSPLAGVARLGDLRLGGLFGTVSSPRFALDLPRYLSLAVLRF